MVSLTRTETGTEIETKTETRTGNETKTETILGLNQAAPGSVDIGEE